MTEEPETERTAGDDADEYVRMGETLTMQVSLHVPNWHDIPNVFCNHMYATVDPTSDSVFLTFVQVVPPNVTERTRAQLEEPQRLEAPATVRIVMPMNRFRSMIDQVNAQYGDWFGDPSEPESEVD